jgi:hypothetical protein
MPIAIARDSRRGWIIARAIGPMTIDEVLDMIRTARAHVDMRMVPMVFDAREATGAATDAQVELAVGAIRDAVRIGGTRGHVALVAGDDDALYAAMLRYETRCGEIGLQGIRAFRQLPDAERWLEIVSASHGTA